MGSHKQTFTGDSSQLQAEYEKILRANVKLEQQVQQLADKTDKLAAAQKGQHQEQQSGFDKAVTGLGRMAASYVSVGTAVNLMKQAITAAIDEQRKLSDEAKDITVKVAESQSQLFRNMIGVPTAQKQAFVAQIREISERTGLDLAQLNIAAGSGLSASAGNERATLDAIEIAGRMVRDNPAEMGDIVGAALDFGSITGDYNAAKNIGFGLGIAGKARITNSRQALVNAAPAIASVVGTGTGDGEQLALEAGAAFAALTASDAKDVTGESSRTSLTSLAVQLRTFFEAMENDPGTFGGRVETLQNDEEMRKAFFDSATFEQRYKIPMEKFLTQGSDVDKLYEANLATLKFDESLTWNEIKDQEEGTYELQLANFSRTLNTKSEGIRGQEGRAERAAQREIFEKLMTDPNLTMMDSLNANFSKTAFSWREVGATSEQRNQMIDAMVEARRKQILDLDSGGGWLLPGQEPELANPSELSEERKKAYDALVELNASFQELKEIMRKVKPGSVQAQAEVDREN